MELLGPIYFWLFAALSVACAGGLLLARHPITGAVNLIGVMLALSGLYALLNAPVLAVLQILVYAGAIMMLVVFVIMVLNQGRDHHLPRLSAASLPLLVVPALLLAVIVATLWRSEGLVVDPEAPQAQAASLAPRLFDVSADGPGYYILFLVVSLVLLVAFLAAVLLAKTRLADDQEGDA